MRKLNDSPLLLALDTGRFIADQFNQFLKLELFNVIKTYRRSDSSTIEADRTELMRLILEGSNKTFDSLPSKEKNLTFNYLEKTFTNILGVSEINNDILLSLELRQKANGFTNAGEMLADKNGFRGIDIVKFGANINTILHRYTFEHISLLEVFDKTMNVYRENYQYEVIEGAYRQKKEKIPEEAFREAIANALVHRDWFMESNIQISMWEESIEIVSPGGLPTGLSEEEYLNGQISIMRNPIVGNIFFRLDIIEYFGTGIKRIREAYAESHKKPRFKIFENSIHVVLPVVSDIDHLTDDKQKVYRALENKEQSSSYVSEVTGFGKSKVLYLLDDLINEGYVKKNGTGRGTTYGVR